MESRYRPGAIVHARGREWIVLPPREPEVLRLRPLTMAQGDESAYFCPSKASVFGRPALPIPSQLAAATRPGS